MAWRNSPLLRLELDITKTSPLTLSTSKPTSVVLFSFRQCTKASDDKLQTSCDHFKVSVCSNDIPTMPICIFSCLVHEAHCTSEDPSDDIDIVGILGNLGFSACPFQLVCGFSEHDLVPNDKISQIFAVDRWSASVGYLLINSSALVKVPSFFNKYSRLDLYVIWEMRECLCLSAISTDRLGNCRRECLCDAIIRQMGRHSETIETLKQFKPRPSTPLCTIYFMIQYDA